MESDERPIVFSAMLRSLLESAGVAASRKKLARALGVNEATISHYLHGRARPSFETLVRLAHFFNVGLDYLVFGDRLPVNVEVDPGGIRSQIHRALLEAADTAGRHLDLTTRISRRLQAEIDAAAHALLEDPSNLGPVGFINVQEAIAMEGCIRQIRIMTRKFQSDVRDGERGTFFDVMTQNLRLGRAYHYLLYGSVEYWRQEVETFRELVRGAGISFEMSHGLLQFRTLDEELFAAVCILSMDETLAERQESILWERHRAGLSPESVWAYISVERSDAQGGIVIDPLYLASALKLFDRDWNRARPI